MKTYFTTLILMGLFFASTFTASFSQTQWTKDTLNNPVLNPGPSGAWDDEFIAMPCILFNGSTYQMWYSIRNDRTRSIGYATSMDHINWTKYNDSTTTTTLYSESDPVLSPGDSGKWDEKSVEAPSVIIIDSVYHMWYRGKNYPGGSSSSIGHATSVDGINWEKDTLNNPVLSPGSPDSWDAGYVGYHTVVFDGSTYHLWYKAWNGGTGTNNHNQIGHATSPHPDSSWAKDPANPVLSFGSSGDWDNPTVFFPNVIYDGNTYHIWYSGGERFEWKIGYATSPHPDSNWTKYANNPVLGWGSLGSWDDTWVGICSVVLDSTNSIFKMWYTGSGGGSDGHIGYATAPLDPNSIKNNEYKNIPQSFVLSQNYPNPFNPSTTIEFTLPKSEFAELKIFNILGKEVAAIVSKKLNPGNHTYTFEAKNLASGVYYYQLVAGNYQDVKKMILLR